MIIFENKIKNFVLNVDLFLIDIISTWKIILKILFSYFAIKLFVMKKNDIIS